jgi:hypothetical protein
VRLAEVCPEVFAKLPTDIASNGDVWRSWFDLEAPEDAEMPMGYSTRSTALQRICLLRCFRVDRVQRGVTIYISDYMGDKFVQPPVVRFEDAFKVSTAFSPVVFILSPGADPGNELQALGAKHGFTGNKFKCVCKVYSRLIAIETTRRDLMKRLFFHVYLLFSIIVCCETFTFCSLSAHFLPLFAFVVDV